MVYLYILWHVDPLLGGGPQTTEEWRFLPDPLSNN
jgi:hypothetical protein